MAKNKYFSLGLSIFIFCHFDFPTLGYCWPLSAVTPCGHVCADASAAEGPNRPNPGGGSVLCTLIHSKLLQKQLGTMDVTIGLTSCFLRFLLPSGWVLSHWATRTRSEGGCPIAHPATWPPPAYPDHVCYIPGQPSQDRITYSYLFCNHYS